MRAFLRAAYAAKVCRGGRRSHGKDELITDMVCRYGKLIYAIALKSCGNPFDAEDITQDTFLAAYKSLAQFDGKNEQAWICKIAANKCLDFMKSTGRRYIPCSEEVFEEQVDQRGSPEEAYLNKEQDIGLLKLCESMEAPYKETAVLHFYEGKTAKEISLLTGTGLKTVQTRILRAKSILKQKLVTERSGGR